MYSPVEKQLLVISWHLLKLKTLLRQSQEKYRDKLGLSGNLYYPDSSTSNITSDLILYPLISFSIHCDVIYIGSLNETTHNIRGISTGIKYYLDSNKNFQL